ncbi:MAG: hypothetical protein ACTSQQ_16360, partial [Candidatus Helarchaeota archaeon]
EGTPRSNVYTTARPINRGGALFLWHIEYPITFQVDPKSVAQIKRTLTDYLADLSLKRQAFQNVFKFFSIL